MKETAGFDWVLVSSSADGLKKLQDLAIRSRLVKAFAPGCDPGTLRVQLSESFSREQIAERIAPLFPNAKVTVWN